MKITEFEEMKIYSYSKNDYRINRGVLETNAINNEWTKSTLPYNTVIELEFIPFIEYVSFEKAIEHMKDGWMTEFSGIFYTLDGTSLSIYDYNRYFPAPFHLEMLEPKWILK